MALITCPECSKQVSDTIDACIHCGFRLKPMNQVFGKADTNIVNYPTADITELINKQETMQNGQKPIPSNSSIHHVDTQNMSEEVKKYLLAAENGDAEGQFFLGYAYENGEGVPRSYVDAARWYRYAATQGDADAQRNLGSLYEHGLGIQMNRDQAIKWYKMSAEQGNVIAQTLLGKLGIRVESSGVRKQTFFASEHGTINKAIICPHCQTTGNVQIKAVTRKEGISGGKVMGGLLTGGLSLLATGLSRKQSYTQAHCANCNSTWIF